MYLNNNMSILLGKNKTFQPSLWDLLRKDTSRTFSNTPSAACKVSQRFSSCLFELWVAKTCLLRSLPLSNQKADWRGPTNPSFGMALTRVDAAHINQGNLTQGIKCTAEVIKWNEISWLGMWFNIVKPRFLFKTADLWSYIYINA